MNQGGVYLLSASRIRDENYNLLDTNELHDIVPHDRQEQHPHNCGSGKINALHKPDHAQTRRFATTNPA